MRTDEIKTHGDAAKILNRYNLKIKIEPSDFFEVAKALLRAEVEGMNKPGDCETCRFISWDGDYGEIQCCDHDKDICEDNGEIEVDGEFYPIGQCPCWETNAPLNFCKKHKIWHTDGWELSCPDCLKDWENGAK